MVARRYSTASTEAKMSARQILTAAPENLVPSAHTKRYRLPEREQPPKNTIPADALEELIGRRQFSNDCIIEGVLTEATRLILKKT
jgi:hypothetical protein